MTSQNSGESNFASSRTGSASGSGSISSSQNENASPLWNYVTKLEKRGYCRNLEFLIGMREEKEGESREVPLPYQSQTGIAIESSSKKRKSNFSPIAKSFNMNMRAQLDEDLEKFLCLVNLKLELQLNLLLRRENPTFHLLLNHST
ncbi:hypothetical protein V6N12_031038 [Hibiscus sabdariffa]|uniref:Uncharacterized protein n=1 Tax=Hibiscus sabdariffa TaxID=183260 RepID=A0ABR2E881_9ROSI